MKDLPKKKTNGSRLILFLLCLAVTILQAAADDFEKDLQKQIAEYEAKLAKMKNPQAREITQGLLNNLRRGDVRFPKADPSASWVFDEVQTTPESGDASSPLGKNWKITPPPRVLKPGEVFTLVAQRLQSQKETREPQQQDSDRGKESSNTAVGALNRVPGRLITTVSFHLSSGRIANPDTLGSKPQFVDASGQDSKSYEKAADGTITARIRLPEKGIPLYLRIVVAPSYQTKKSVTYLYRYTTEPQTEVKITALDANPQFCFDKLPEELLTTELVRLSEIRDGCATDGVSQLILRAELATDQDVSWALEGEDAGEIVPLLKGETIYFEEKHYAFARYSPPSHFGGDLGDDPPKALFHPKRMPKLRLGEILEYRPVTVSLRAGGTRFAQGELKLVRPPVVLVHGLMSNAYDCWVKTKPSGLSMTVLLEKAGLMPWTVNYQTTNGEPLVAAEGSSFADNWDVVWNRADPYHYQPFEEKWFIDDVQFDPTLSVFQRGAPKRVGGIFHAITHYRNEFKVAATQADVIGHSMGGLLTRKYIASPIYRRPENFQQGDVHRIITLNTPHHGSELAHVYEALLEAEIDGESWKNWIVRAMARKAGNFIGVRTPAVVDLTAPLTEKQAEDSALRAIGPTPVPAHAIATHAALTTQDTREYDGILLYRSLYGTLGMTFFHNRPLLDDFVDRRFDEWNSAPDPIRVLPKSPPDDLDALREQYKETIQGGIDQAVHYWERRLGADYIAERIEKIQPTSIVEYGHYEYAPFTEEKSYLEQGISGLSKLAIGGDLLKFQKPKAEQDVPPEVVKMISDLIFHNDEMNDGAVRVASQYGGLEEPYRSKPDVGILHSFSPWNYRVQKMVIELLKWEDYKFDPEGFKEAPGQLMRRHLPDERMITSRTMGEKAIRWSGVVPSHAEVYGKVADQNDAIIIVRPVNRDSTALIEGGAATKAMAVKGKSSNWGPQKGYIAVKQRFSKIWQVYKSNPAVRKSQIKTFDGVTQKMLGKIHPVKKLPYAKERKLIVNGREVLTDPDEPDAEKAIYLFDGKTFTHWATNREIKPDAKTAERLKANPLLVLADGTSDKDPKPYLTADYDLLAIGFHDPDNASGMPLQEIVHQTPDDFDDLMGFVTEDQKDLIEELNDRVFSETGYEGGNVTHHGPEVQYAASPYVDYPLLVCDPGDPDVDGDQVLFIIHMGPLGYRDIHLKRYFSNRIRKNFALWPNPESEGWKWEHYSNFNRNRGYDPRDAPTLLAYVDEQPDPDSDGENSLDNQIQQARRGDLQAQLALARHYLKGEDDTPDAKQFAYWSDQASKHNSADAYALRAEGYLSGFGVEKDPEKAVDLLKKSMAIEKTGHAHYLLSYASREGLGLPKDNDKADQFLEAAAKKNYPFALIDLGNRYLDDGRPELALTYYERAIQENGSPEAHLQAGTVHYYSDLGAPNWEKARDHFLAACKDDPGFDAHFFLGSIYLDGGNGVGADFDKAFQNLSKAASAGHRFARHALGVCHRDGKGTPKDLPTAYMYLKLAVFDGVDAAVETINDLQKQMSAEQVAEGDALHAEYGMRN